MAYCACWQDRGRQFPRAGGIEAYFADQSNAWERVSIVSDEFRDLGDRVLVLGRTAGRGKGSGVEVDAPMGTVLDFRDGKISHIRAFLDHGEALRAAGLSE
jgi:ketosteroid isomerase-like protein